MVAESGVRQDVYGVLKDGREVRIFTLRNTNGIEARVMEYGAILVSVTTPDASGTTADITLGYDNFNGWLDNSPFFGATVGRVGNRIAHGKFTLYRQEYTLVTNNEPGGIPCHLHGGTRGFDKVLWAGEVVTDNAVRFSYLSEDGEEGYPGNLSVHLTYTLTEENELIWQVEAVTDAPTVVNIAHHTYWNLSGKPGTTVLGHELTLHAPHYLPTNAGLIPTGELAPVTNTPMDFTKPTIIGDRIHDDFEALKFGNGYDHCWVLGNAGEMKLAAKVKDPKSGRVMEVSTDQPGIQFYCGNFIDALGKGGVHYTPRTGLCLETENFPDAPNQPSFPSAILRPGETYRHVMVHKFSNEP